MELHVSNAPAGIPSFAASCFSFSGGSKTLSVVNTQVLFHSISYGVVTSYRRTYP